MSIAFAAFDLDHHARGATRPRRDCRIGQPRCVDFRALVGRRAWFELPPAVRRRFDLAAHGDPQDIAFYPGRMTLRASWLGVVISQVCRLIGTPLAPFTGDDIPVTVEVHADGRGGMVWDRTYHYRRRAPVLVTSRKVADADGSLMEVVRNGMGMRLVASVEDRALHFRSRGYFFEIAGCRIDIPGLLTPGAVHVIHAETGPGTFRFTLTFHHRLFGETLHQSGLFRDTTAETRP
jgi:hypothetical protein